MTKIILDTDIGDDIDDALALGLICASPELQLVGVTTVFGNVSARARQARTVLKVAGDRFAAIPVAAGCGATMASRPNRIGRAYREDALPNQDSTCLPEEQLFPLDPRHAVNFLIDTITAGDGDIVPITIGAMTNLATALVMERRITKKIPKIVAMAAEFKRPMAEWNVLCDPEAAHIVFSSGIPMEIITFDIGKIVMFDRSHIDQLNRSPRPLASRLAAAIGAWKQAHPHDPGMMPSLYDPMAVATLIQPDLCTWKTGTVSVELAGSHTYGFTTFSQSERAPHLVAWDANRDASLDFYLKRILAF